MLFPNRISPNLRRPESMTTADTPAGKLPLILIADADPYVRNLTSHFISQAGYDVMVASDGYEALGLARKSIPVVILADVMLPKLDGLALCQILKSDPETEGIVAVIVFSVLSANERALKAGADAFIKKPIEKKRLFKTLNKFLQIEENE